MYSPSLRFFFPVVVIKYPNKSNLRDKGFVLAHSFREFVREGMLVGTYGCHFPLLSVSETDVSVWD